MGSSWLLPLTSDVGWLLSAAPAPDELWMEVRDIVQETGIKTIPMEKKCKKTKWMSEEALQIAVKIYPMSKVIETQVRW